LLILYSDPWFALAPGVLLVFLYLIFRDPHRSVPSIALGVFSPVDGKVVAVDQIEQSETGAPAFQIVIRVNSLGTYTARSPVEGSIKDLGRKGLWLQTDEGEDVVLIFSGHRLGLAPRAFAKFGERLGQGQRCAFLRLTRTAEIQLPIDGKILVEPGQTVVAGADVIGNLPSSR
jgi:phosphatidylserine decarboxylase